MDNKNNRKTVLMFPGQGSQYEGMGMDYIDLLNKSNNDFNIASDLLGENIADVITGNNVNSAALDNTYYSQVSIFTLSAAINDYLFEKKYLDISSVLAVMGHSLGDYSALYSCGFFNFRECLEIVAYRGKLMADANEKMDGMMAAVLGTDYDTIKNLLANYRNSSNEEIYMANYNDYSQIVISGKRDNMEKAIGFLKENGVRKVIPLKVKIASHTPLMKDVSERLGEYFKGIVLNEPKLNFYSTTYLGFPKREEVKSVMKDQLVIPINWVKSIEYFLNQKADTFIEIGPGKVLSNLVRRISEKNSLDVSVFNTDKLSDLNNLIESVS